jgi:hypothetical protein
MIAVIAVVYRVGRRDGKKKTEAGQGRLVLLYLRREKGQHIHAHIIQVGA